MADWGGIARAVEEGLLDDTRARDTSSGGLRDIAEALTGQDFSGFRVRDIFDKDRWSRRERERQGRRLEETGIPDYTYDYNPRDQAVTTGLGPQSDVQGQRISGGHAPATPGWQGNKPEGNIRQWGTQNPNQPGSMALDPTWAGGLRGAGLGAEMTPGAKFGEDRGTYLHPDFMATATPGEIDYELSVARGEVPYDKSGASSSGIQNRFGNREFSPRSRTNQGIAGGRDFMRARKARELRNEIRRPGMGGGPAYQGHGLGHPDWSQIEATIQREAILDRLQGRDER